MVIHSVHVGVLLRSSLAGEGVSNREVANGEKEDIEYFAAGTRVCVTPNERNGKQKEGVKRDKFYLLPNVILTLPCPREVQWC